MQNLKIGDIVFDKYKIVKELGHGGMNSTIFLAKNTLIKNDTYYGKTNEFVAIKIINWDKNISEDQWDKFIDECFTNIRLKNRQNIVNTYEIRKLNNDKTVVIIMEYIDGISLRYYINQYGSLSINEAIYIFKNILIAIKILHELPRKIIHRDLKPENILLSKDLKEIKIIDFGISSVIGKSSDNNNSMIFTSEKTLYGTYPYISPDIYNLRGLNSNEQKASVINEQFDFYSLGVILYEMLSGTKPFLADSYDDQKIIKLPLQFDVPILSDVNADISIAIDNIIFKCLASKQEDIKYRYNNINEIINDIEKYENNQNYAEKLIKPREKRIFQCKQVFNVEKQKHNEKFYYKWWFYILLASILIVLVILILILELF